MKARATMNPNSACLTSSSLTWREAELTHLLAPYASIRMFARNRELPFPRQSRICSRFLSHSSMRPASNLSVIGPKLIQVKAELAQKKEVFHAGNKLPRYYFVLDWLNREVPELKNILIYRSPRGFMPSWNRRELAGKEAQWPAGQIGLFGLLELIVCIDNCLRQTKEILVFPHESGLNHSIDPSYKRWTSSEQAKSCIGEKHLSESS